MARYHFHVHNGRELRDEDGTEMADLDAARAYAVRYAGELLAGDGEAFWQAPEWRMEVADADGLICFALHIFAIEAPVIPPPVLGRAANLEAAGAKPFR